MQTEAVGEAADNSVVGAGHKLDRIHPDHQQNQIGGECSRAAEVNTRPAVRIVLGFAVVAAIIAVVDSHCAAPVLGSSKDILRRSTPKVDRSSPGRGRSLAAGPITGVGIVFRRWPAPAV